MRIVFAALLAIFCGAIAAQNNPMYSVSSWSAPPPITTGHTVLSLGDDGLSAEISPQNFAFPYFGDIYTSFRVGANGYIILGGSGSTQSAAPNHATSPGLCIAPFWADMVPAIGDVRWVYDGLAGKLTVKWGQPEVRNALNPPAAAAPSLQLDCGSGEILFWYGKILQTFEDPMGGARTSDPHTIAISGPSGPNQEIINGESYISGQINPDGSVANYPLTGKPPEVHIKFTPTARMLTITTMGLPQALSGQGYAFQFASMLGVGQTSWSATGLPAGWSMAPNGVLSAPGHHVVAGQFTFDVTVRDSASTPNTDTNTFTLTILPGPLAIYTPADLPHGNAGGDYATQFVALGGQPPFEWTAIGLPAGYTLLPTGLLGAMGADVAAGDYYFSVSVRDGLDGAAAGQFHLRIDPPVLDITSPNTLPPAVAGAEYRFVFAGSGGFAPYQWSGPDFSGPWSIDASSGELVVIASAAVVGVHQFRIELRDSDGPPALRLEHFTLEFTEAPLPLTIERLQPPPARVMLGYVHQFHAFGGVPPYQWSASGLPAGWQLDAEGRLAGVAPDTPQLIQFTVHVVDFDSPQHADNWDVTLTVEHVPPPPLEISTAALPRGRTGEPYSAVLMAQGGGAGGFSWSLSAGALPAGVEGLPGEGTPGVGLYGVPTAVGNFILHVTVTDAAGHTATKLLSILVEEGEPMAGPMLNLGDGPTSGCAAAGNGGWMLALLPLLWPALRRRRRA